MSKNKTKQEEIIEMMNIFCKLPKEKQMYVSGIITGLSLQRDVQVRQEIKMNA